MKKRRNRTEIAYYNRSWLYYLYNGLAKKRKVNE
jgi:hypothetical protein